MESSFNDDEGEGILLPLQGNRDLLSVVEPPNDHGLEECALTFAQMHEVQQRLLELSADASANISGPTGSAIEIADGKQCIDVDNGVGENGGENQEQALQDAAKEALQLRKLQSIFDEAPLVDQTVADFNFTLRTCNSEEVQLRIQQSPLLAARLGDTNECSAKEAIGPCSTEVESATGAVVWDSTVVLARLVEQAAHSESLSSLCVVGRHCVELGAGCGLLSCVAWHCGAASVLASDRQEILSILEKNCRENCACRDLKAPISVVAHMWGDPIECLLGPSVVIDGNGTRDKQRPSWIIFAVDCLYDVEAVASLLTTISRLRDVIILELEGELSIVVAADESYRRPEAIRTFMSSLPALGFNAKELVTTSLPEDQQRSSVHLWLLKSL